MIRCLSSACTGLIVHYASDQGGGRDGGRGDTIPTCVATRPEGVWGVEIRKVLPVCHARKRASEFIDRGWLTIMWGLKLRGASGFESGTIFPNWVTIWTCCVVVLRTTFIALCLDRGKNF